MKKYESDFYIIEYDEKNKKIYWFICQYIK